VVTHSSRSELLFSRMSSFSGGGGGCGLCGTETSSSSAKNLTAKEFETINEILTSFNSSSDDSTTNNPGFNWAGLEYSQVVFCADCHCLLQEMKRLQVLVKLVSSQLDAVVSKVRVNYAERPVWVKAEEITNEKV